MHKDLLPPMLWSASTHICKSLPDAWVFTWTADKHSVTERETYRNSLNLSQNKFLEMQTWFDALLNEDLFGYPNVFFDLEYARLAYHRFFQIPNVKLLSIALSEIFVDDFIEEFTPGPGIGENGVRKKLRQKVALEEDGQFLGYEILGHDYANFCSFLCNSLEKEYQTGLGIAFNEFGLIQTYGDALKAAEYTMRPDVGAEPLSWHPWRVSKYTLDK